MGDSWTVAASACIPQSGTWYDYPYRSTLSPRVDDGVLGFDVWMAGYTTAGSTTWHIGRTRLSISTTSTATMETIATSETDTALVFAPDGAGGVTARAEAGVINYHFEAILDDTPSPILTNDGTDWVYGKVYDA